MRRGGSAPPVDTTPGGILQLLRSQGPLTRADLAQRFGLSQAAISPRVAALLAAGLIEEQRGASTGGRPAGRLAFNPAGGVVLVADLGRTHCRLAVADLHGMPLVERAADRSLMEGPARVLPWLLDTLRELLASTGRADADVMGLGVAMPGPVEFGAGRAVSPPALPGWDGVDIHGALQDRTDAPVIVDNDANAEALGEYWTNWRHDGGDLVYVKCGTGIGCGIVLAGSIHRGVQGASGEIGHVPVSAGAGLACGCGNSGCLETVAGGRALVERLSNLGHEVSDARGVIDLLRRGNPDATRLIRQAGRALGEVLAATVNLLNPSAIVIGGDLAAAEDVLLTGVREVVYQRATVLATRSLKIARSAQSDRSGVIGAAITVLDEVLAPAEVNRLLYQTDQASA